MIAVNIVTFNPNLENLKNLVNTLINCDLVSRIYIVDNSSDIRYYEKDIVFNSEKIAVFNLTENKGIAFAQNLVINEVLSDNVAGLLFFDQDSTIDEYFVENLIDEFYCLSEKNKIAAIGPRFFDKEKKFLFPALTLNKINLINKNDLSNNKFSMEVCCLISSGMFISVEALKNIGNMKEEFFIDYVDTEWCFRALSKGYKLFISKQVVMDHSIGDDTIKVLNFNIPVHSGFRRYYRIRNLFFMWKMPYIPKILTAKLMLSNFVHQILLILIKDKKNEYIKYYLKAIRDGLKQSKDYHV